MQYEKIWKKVLNPDEKVEYEFSIGNRYKMFYLILCCIIGVILLFSSSYFIGIIIIGAAIFHFVFYLKWANAYAFTNKRIVIYRGWLSTELTSIDYDKITDVIVEEPIVDKLITSTGHLIINTAGAGFSELKQNQKLEHIENPYETKKKLDEIRGLVINKN